MKTSVIMTRRMGQFEVLQRTKDGMFNATALLNQWNRAAGMKKEMNDYLRLQSTHDFLSALQSEFDFKDGNSPYLTTNPHRDSFGGFPERLCHFWQSKNRPPITNPAARIDGWGILGCTRIPQH